METTTLAHRNVALQLNTAPEIPGLDDMDRSDMILPRMRLVQAQSQFSEEAGQLHNSLTDTAKPFINAVFIGVKKGRVKWPLDFQRGQDPECASDDGLQSRDGLYGMTIEGDPTTICAECINSVWLEDSPPTCAAFYNFLALDVDEGDVPFLVSFGRTSARSGKQLVTLLKTFGLRRTIVVGAVQQTNDRGKFYVLTVKPGDALDAERQAHYATMARAFAGLAITSDTDAVEPPPDGNGGGAEVPF